MRGGTEKRKGRMGVDSRSRGSTPAVAELNRRFRLALFLYVALAVLVWFTMDEGKVLVWGRPVELRWLPLIVLGGLAVRTYVAWQAEQIRCGRDEETGRSSGEFQKKG
ncbi:MAG: hypothetical protein ACP5FH_11875 [Terracidiphilus sp.]